jgi:hypothetical protein
MGLFINPSEASPPIWVETPSRYIVEHIRLHMLINLQGDPTEIERNSFSPSRRCAIVAIKMVNFIIENNNKNSFY